MKYILFWNVDISKETNMTRRMQYPDSPKRSDFEDFSEYKRAYGRWMYANGHIAKRGPNRVKKLPSEKEPRVKKKLKKRESKKNPYGHNAYERATAAERALIIKTKAHTAKCEAEIASRVEFLDHYEGPDLDLDTSAYLLENWLPDIKNF